MIYCAARPLRKAGIIMEEVELFHSLPIIHAPPIKTIKDNMAIQNRNAMMWRSCALSRGSWDMPEDNPATI